MARLDAGTHLVAPAAAAARSLVPSNVGAMAGDPNNTSSVSDHRLSEGLAYDSQSDSQPKRHDKRYGSVKEIISPFPPV